MKVSEMKRLLRKSGCRFDHDGGNHEIWYSPMTNKYFPIPRHDSKELATGTADKIKSQAGLK